MGNHFDADAWLAAHEPPTVTIGGKTYTGRLLSYQEFLPFLVRVDKVVKHDPSEDFLGFARDYLTTIFPTSPFIRWKPSVASQLLLLPNLGEVLAGFLALQTAAMELSSSPQETSGTEQPKEQ